MDAPAADPAVFALLDDGGPAAAGEAPRSRLYRGFLHEHRCTDPATLDAVAAAAGADLAAGRALVLLADYEWGARLIGAGTAALAPGDRSALRLLVFERMDRLDADGVARWLAERERACEREGQAGADDPAGADAPAAEADARGGKPGAPAPPPGPAGVLELRPAITRARFEQDIARIHEAIRDGETYQVNHTYRLHGRAWGSPWALYRRLRARQAVAYGALIRLPCGPGDAVEWVLSRSPELFVRHAAGRLAAKPMKGTAARASAPEGDSETARLLHADVKNRAENLMIVDLLRNDLGRIAELGSVRVPALFEVEPYATVFQMTSTVEARLRPEVGLAGLLRALFPCGSITGAPKHHTMDWIARLEQGPRGLYTGAIGWLDAPPPGHACPELCLSVAIRTLTLGPAGEDTGSAVGTPAGTRPLTLGVGGGIVLDSVAADEYEETRWKARFLTALDPGLALIETLRATPDGALPLRAGHRERLARSAAALGFALDLARVDALLDDRLAQLRAAAAPADWRLRLLLHADGRVELQHAPLPPLPPGPLRLRVDERPLPAARPLAGHKTTDRARYDAGVRAAEAAGAFDTLFLTADGRLVEGGRSSLFLRLDGRWYTPPLTDGALPGVMRAEVLDDPRWAAAERTLRLDDLVRAEAVMVCNALRGCREAVVVR
ncbi:chorismate-binding protein [Piscinibacter sakaiensis]|uniref:Para-aminobenzoate synthase, aminase component/aminodeoxychorismate lyase n=1 Tax=Piscinibacter sakaiensis TaxID=1547922 RepID=A0A0K8P579_PISS1|nr:chorismate-binding protein [Piscinibacter sakaiensis]GAP37731.1 para-aminobenzoate synthase, aminase component/aminodeoxychorismate lyase [Piscinibacter sakaiensis]